MSYKFLEHHWWLIVKYEVPYLCNLAMNILLLRERAVILKTDCRLRRYAQLNLQNVGGCCAMYFLSCERAMVTCEMRSDGCNPQRLSKLLENKKCDDRVWTNAHPHWNEPLVQSRRAFFA